jgi:hypothetical protein
VIFTPEKAKLIRRSIQEHYIAWKLQGSTLSLHPAGRRQLTSLYDVHESEEGCCVVLICFTLVSYYPSCFSDL